VREEISLKNHSIASQSVYKREELRAKSGESGNNGIIAKTTSSTTTGIKKEISYEGEEESEEEIEKQQKFKQDHRRNQVRTISSQKNVTVEPISELPRNTTQKLVDLDLISRNYLLKYTNNENSTLSRSDRLNMKKLYLRHLVQRHQGLHQARKDSLMRSRQEFMRAHNLWKKINNENEERLKNTAKKCFTRDCNDEAIFTSDFCGKHIVCGEREQFLIRQCCFLHDNGQQCRVPVYDILATVAVCNDHLNAVSKTYLINTSKLFIEFYLFFVVSTSTRYCRRQQQWQHQQFQHKQHFRLNEAKEASNTT
jgi:Potential DNA-binding domain